LFGNSRQAFASFQAATPGTAKHTRLVNKLCNHNLRLVVRYTKQYMSGGKRNLHWGSEETLDLLQEGAIGLRRAAVKFDPTKGYTFATYSCAWVRQALGKYHVDKLSLIRVPESSAREIFYYQNHGRPRNERSASWVAEASIAAQAAYGLVSYDCKLTIDSQESTISVLSDENRVGHVTCKPDYSLREALMVKLGIEQKIRDVIISYCKRGNLDTAMMKNKLVVSKANRAKVREAIALVKGHCAAQ